MKLAYVPKCKLLKRRHVLKGAGAMLALPMLDAMTPVFGSLASRARIQSPRRFVAICATLGFHTPHLFPGSPDGASEANASVSDYELGPYMQCLADHRNDLSLFSGLSHPEQNGNSGHASSLTWLTSARRPGLAGFKNTISIDQLIAAKVGIETRIPSLVLSTNGQSMSWSASGVEIPGETRPSVIFKEMFVNGTATEVEAQIRKLERGRSVLDTLLEQSKQLDRTLGVRDKRKFAEYLVAIRELEYRLQQAKAWARKPKPAIEQAAPTDIADRLDAIAKQRLMYDTIALALQSDSTRLTTFQLSGMNAVPKIGGVSHDWHNLSHHGKDETKIAELQIIEEAEFTVFGEFLTKLKAIQENGHSLLNSTAVLFGSNLGNASAHDWRNLPILVAGGGYEHGGYHAHEPGNNTPFANMFVSLAQRMGVEVRQFGSSTGETVRGLRQL
jgi:hypothetical protein